jgi:outer membrane protein assembly factor BamD
MRRLWAAGAALVVLFGCASTRNVEVLDADQLYSRAMGSLAAKEWTEAVDLFERLTLEYPQDPRFQEARFRIGEAHYGKKEYVTAADEFARLASDYPTGPWADDARFKVCESYNELSPTMQLDQQYTISAIEHCESLVGYYPDSEYVPRAQAIAARLEQKLAEKALAAGEFYLRRRAYDSALIYFDTVVRDFPTTTVAPRALLRTVQTYRALGYKEEMEAARERLLKEYPTSAEAKQAQDTSVANTS